MRPSASEGTVFASPCGAPSPSASQRGAEVSGQTGGGGAGRATGGGGVLRRSATTGRCTWKRTPQRAQRTSAPATKVLTSARASQLGQRWMIRARGSGAFAG